MRIDACFDSHVHWAATGEFSQRLQLDQLRAADQVQALKVEPHHHRGDWLLGYGFDPAAWTVASHRKWLDEWRPGEAIVLTARDGHQRWLSTEALRRAGLMDPNARVPEGGRVERDARGEPTGLISDRACELVDLVLPPATALSMRRDLLAAIRTFNEAGFTHVRDLTCDEAQWHEAVRIDQSGLLTLAVEEFFWAKDVTHLDRVLDLARRARAESTTNLRARGIKLFYDGALGNSGALLSCAYHGAHGHGLELWTETDLREVLRRAWAMDLEVAVHAIGDEAGDRVVSAAAAVTAAGQKGALHLEHAQLLRPETITKMRGLNLRCHLQPSHWLEDRAWLSERVGTLTKLAFPWRRLQEADIAFDFGSDAPIEPPSVARTFRALTESAEAGVPRLLGRPETYMRHPDPSWTPNSFTLFEDLVPRQVVFRGEHLI